MNREPEIETLLNAARDVAIHTLEGLKATPDNLKHMAAIALHTVLAQAEAGMWATWAITTAHELRALKCTVRLRAPSLVGISQRPIEIVWNWLDTPLRHLQTEG